MSGIVFDVPYSYGALGGAIQVIMDGAQSAYRVNLELSRQVAQNPRVQPEQHQCFYNVFRALLYAPELENGVRVEGFIADGPMMNAHAWVELDHEIIDPSLASLDGACDWPMVYFPGVRLPFEQYMDLLGTCKSKRDKAPLHTLPLWKIEDIPEWVKDKMSQAEKAARAFVGRSM